MKINLIIDGNYLLHKSVFVLFETKTLYSDLPVLLRKDMDRLAKMFSYDRIYFVSDSKHRWRKKIYDQYKATRKADEKIDWDFVFEEFNKFKIEVGERKNVSSYEIPYLEGDDLISFIIQESNNLGYSNVIIASDGDLHQLLKFDLGLKYINIMYNYKFSDERLYIPKNYFVFMTEILKKSIQTLFDMNSDNEFIDFINQLKSKTKCTEINPEESLFCKLVTGDKKDNIPSVYVKESLNGNKRGIGITGGLSLYKLYKEISSDTIDFDNDNFIEKVTDVISYNKKIKDATEIDNIKKNIQMNRTLIRLDKKYLPVELFNKMQKFVKIIN
jgi:5'-3' exonuclease